jgi:hypothetical protein
MSKPEYLSIFLNGVEEWNSWRSENREDYDEHIDLSNEDMSYEDLTGFDFSDTDLSNVNFTGATLDWADFYGATVNGTIFSDIDLSKVFHLDYVHHRGPSILGLDSIYQSQGKIPLKFLRGCGLSDLDIEYAKLAAPGLDPNQVIQITYEIYRLYCDEPIKFYSCFISHSTEDTDFANRLYEDLQNEGVRCWLAMKDLKIGDPIRPTIDQQIRLRDKLLVILSENSIKSEWVGDEVEAAIEEESKSNRMLLFPIRLDDVVMNIQDGWSAKIRRTRNIGDFSNWPDPVSYQRALDCLLQDLKATGDPVHGQ